MTKKIIFTKKSPKPVGPYSQAIQVGNLIFVSGQVAFDPESSKIVSGGIEEQTAQTLENIRNILESVNLSLDDVVRVTVFLKDIADFKAMNTIYNKYFSKDPPTRTTVQANLIPGALIMIDAIAYKP